MIPAGTPLGAVQVTLGDGPVVGQVDPTGRLLHLGKLEGWWDPPATSGSSTQKTNDHGVFLGPAYYSGRVVQLEARIDGWNPADSMAAARQLINALEVDTLVQLSITDEAETLTAAVRQEGDPLLARAGNRVTVSLSMLAPDPRRYGAESTVTVGLPVAAGGRSLPLSLPLSLGGVSSDGTVTIVNTGDIASYPVFTVAGPCPPFTITDAVGHQLASADDVPAGRQLVIDTATRTALLDGTANRVVTGTWLSLVPGTNTFSFQAATYDAGARLYVTYRSARR